MDDSMTLIRPCCICGEPADPLAFGVLQKVVGWQQKSHTRASGKQGGSDIFARQPRDEYAHRHCVEQLRRGIAPGQGRLI